MQTEQKFRPIKLPNSISKLICLAANLTLIMCNCKTDIICCHTKCCHAPTLTSPH